MRASPRIAALLLLVLTSAQAGWYGRRLPDPVASHFGFDGTPDGWSSPGGFLFAMVVMNVATLGLLFGCAWLIRKLDGRGVNIPNPEYWLAPERRRATVAHIGGQLEWYGVAIYFFLMVVTQLTIAANFADPVRLPQAPFWTLMGAFVLYSAWWALRLITCFQFKKEDGGS